MVSAFSLALKIAQTKSFCRILQRHMGSLHMISMNPLVIRILQVLLEIVTRFYAGMLEGLMVGGRDESPLLSNTMAEHSTLLSSAVDEIRICSK